MASRQLEAHTSTLAEWIAGLAFDDLDHVVRERIPLHVLDFVAVAAAGGNIAESSNSARASAYAPHLGPTPTGKCTVIGEHHTLGPERAAFLNGTYAHSLDFDDTTISSSLHPGAPVIAAALPLAESLRVSGERLITSLAAGYEVACRVGESLGQSPYERGFHPTGLAGIFGAVSAGASLLGFDPHRTEDALGVAGSMAAGSLQCLEDGTWNKRIHPGLAARNAIFALELAGHGFRGARDSLVGKYGVLQAFSTDPRPELLLSGLGETWSMLGTGIKPYPACRLTHGAIDAALELRTRLTADQITQAKFTVEISPIAYTIVGEPGPQKQAPSTAVDGQFSVYFQVASALLHGNIGWSVYDQLESPDVRALISKIDVVANAEIEAAGANLGMVGGEAVRVDAPSGEPGEGMNFGVVSRKFESITSAVWEPSRQHEIVSAVGALSQSADVYEPIRLFAAGPKTLPS